jgi:hypothetical protein
MQAAQWRQEHRGDEFEQRKLIVWEVDDEPEPWQGRHCLTGDSGCVVSASIADMGCWAFAFLK